MMRGARGFQAALRRASSSLVRSTLMVFAGMSIVSMSPSSRSPIGPPTAASGETWPMAAPRVAPEKRPSVMSATHPPRPEPMMAEVGLSISRMPGPPLGPS